MSVWPSVLTPSPTPLREIVKSSSIRRKRAIKSIKAADGMIECESDHEADFAILAELDPNVTQIFSQPFSWSHHFDGQRKKHLPDFGLVINGTAEIHEVKELAKTHEDVEWNTRCGWADWCSQLGVPYSLTLDVHLEGPVQRRCISDLWFQYNRPVEAFLTLRIQSLLEACPLKIGTIIEALSPPKPHFDELLALAAQGKIYIDATNDFSLATLVRFPDPTNPPPRLIPFFSPILEARP